jgi:subtilisin family serine protease
MKTFLNFSIALSIAALLLFPFPAGAQHGPTPAGLSPLKTSRPAQAQRTFQPRAKFNRVENPIPNKYIVILNDDVAPGRGASSARSARVNAAAANLTQQYGGRVGFTYDALKAFSVDSLNEQAAIALSHNPQVKFVEEAGMFHLSDVQSNPPWGLDRIDQAGPVGTVTNGTTSGSYVYNATGSGVTAYVVDGGVRTSHSQFGGRAAIAADYIGTDGCTTTSTNDDCNGHGTHVAGTIGGSTYGVAKGVTIRSVKVCNSTGSCPLDAIIAGMNFVMNEHYTTPSTPKVANMSLGGSPSDSLDYSVFTAIDAGVTVVVAAGNNGWFAGSFSPARLAQAITVGASGPTDQGAQGSGGTFFSNFGPPVDVWAPGEGVLSAWFNNDNDTNIISGTSMASPHTAGAVALYLQGRTATDWCAYFPISNPSPAIGGAISTCPDRVAQFIKSNASLNKLSNINVNFGSPNRLLYTGSLPSTANPIDNQRFFVWQQYADFLNAEPDENGLDSWTGSITGPCSTGFNDNNSCTQGKRIDVSRAFFVSAFPSLFTSGGTQLTNNADFLHKCYEVYLRRSVSSSDGGFQFWLNDLNNYGNPANQNGINHLIDAFISSIEYHQRFGQ